MDLNNFYRVSESATSYKATLVVVCKNQSIENIQAIYSAGQRIFAENKVQEMLIKKKVLPPDIQWHMIGNLQKNKVRPLIPWNYLIHSVDSFALASKINEVSKEFHTKTNILLEFKVAQEHAKHGWSKKELLDSLQSDDWKSLHSIEICGAMTMASFTAEKTIIEKEFDAFNEMFQMVKSGFFPGPNFSIKSFGMSGDYQIALDKGSNMIRVGSLIFD